MDAIDAQAPVAALVTEKPARAAVLERHGIDYCCGGRLPLAEACARAGVGLDQLAAEMAELDAAAPADTTDWSRAPLGVLADHIVETHHGRLYREMPRLVDLAAKVVNAHGDRHPELAEVQRLVSEMWAELKSHCFKEENILFPYCQALDEADQAPWAPFGTVQNPVLVMEQEHDTVAQILRRLRSLTGGYAPPEDACPTYRVMLESLRALEQDLHLHIHKENNILFPRAIAREAELRAAA